jgi:hypothetical protein
VLDKNLQNTLRDKKRERDENDRQRKPEANPQDA